MSSKLKKLVDPVSYKRLFAYVGKYGFKGIWGKFVSGMHEGEEVIDRYPDWFARHKITETELNLQKLYKYDYSPVISILVPTYNTPEEYLRKMIDSVVEQSYVNWELCIADGSTDEKTRQILKEYAEKDSRIKINWLDKNYGISGNTNKALDIATGEFIGLLDHDDYVEPNLLFEIVKELQDKEVDIVYTDEDKVMLKKKEWKETDPNFKPDFSIDLFRSHNYITHFFTVKADIMRGVGGFDSLYDGSQDYDLMFRCIEEVWRRHPEDMSGRTENTKNTNNTNNTENIENTVNTVNTEKTENTPASKMRERHIMHVAKPLYHWRIHQASTAGNPESKMYCYEAGKNAIKAHLERLGIKAEVEMTDMWGMYHVMYETPGNPKLSIIIPNKDHTDDLKKCIKSVMQINTYKNIEFIIVENNSEEEKTFEVYKELEAEYPCIKVVYWKGIFNYAAINNFGAKAATGDYYLLLNNDTELISPDGIKEMLGICMRDDVGIVGAKLLFEDNTVQHAGIVLGFGGFAGHVFSGIDENGLGYMMRARINCNYSAVTGACLMVKKSVFEEVGGLTEKFVVGLNDVDFCLKVRDKGYMVVYDAFSKWHHYESKSRGYEDTPEKKARLQGEVDLFRSIWGKVLDEGDPYYNKNFPVTIAPFTLD